MTEGVNDDAVREIREANRRLCRMFGHAPETRQDPGWNDGMEHTVSVCSRCGEDLTDG